MGEKILLVIGAGTIGRQHLTAAIAAGAGSCAAFAPSARRRSEVEALGARFFTGDVGAALDAIAPTHVVIAVPAESLADTTRALIQRGARKLLVEKPGALASREMRALAELAHARGADARLALNRRWYGSVLAALDDMAARGETPRSARFDFTERAADIARSTVSAAVKARWAIANSVHVIDLALHPILGAAPPELVAFRAGCLPEHAAGSRFAGAGTLSGGAVFSYTADWESPGGWAVEWMTASRRYLFQPLETLRIQEPGRPGSPVTLPPEPGPKPGFLRQMVEFLSDSPSSRMATLAESARLLGLIERLCGYENCL